MTQNRLLSGSAVVVQSGLGGLSSWAARIWSAAGAGVTFTAPFLLACQGVGSDGYLHAVANARETQWAVRDPTTDLAADVCPDEPDWELSTQVWARLPMAPDAAAD